MTRRKLNKKKGFRGFKVIIDISVLKELDIYINYLQMNYFLNKIKKKSKKAYKFYSSIK